MVIRRISNSSYLNLQSLMLRNIYTFVIISKLVFSTLKFYYIFCSILGIVIYKYINLDIGILFLLLGI